MNTYHVYDQHPEAARATCHALIEAPALEEALTVAAQVFEGGGHQCAQLEALKVPAGDVEAVRRAATALADKVPFYDCTSGKGAPAPRRLLVLACSASKRDVSGPVPAIELYDGPAYRVLRKHRDEGGAMPEVWILSAEHGLIPAQRLVAPYDRRMDAARARELACLVDHRMQCRELLQAADEVLVVAGAQYRGVIDSWATAGPRLTYRGALGGIGEKLAELRRWLQAEEVPA